MAKFGRYDSSNKKNKGKSKERDSFKRIKESDKGNSRSGFKTYLKAVAKNLVVDPD